MQGETEEKPKRRRRKKSRFGYYLYAVVILLLTITNITLAMLLLTYVQNIEISGTENSDQSEIAEWIQEDPLTVNSLYTILKFQRGNYELPVYLKDIKVGLGAPWTLKVEVTEKEEIGCIIAEDGYVYFDEEGLVLRRGLEPLEGIPLIEGLQVKNVKQFEKLQVDNEKVFSYIVNITEEIEKQKLSPERIVWEDDSMNLYFGEVCVQLGKTDFEEKLMELPPILEKLEGKKGVLRMEYYSETNDSISFEEAVENTPEENAEENTEENVEE